MGAWLDERGEARGERAEASVDAFRAKFTGAKKVWWQWKV